MEWSDFYVTLISSESSQYYPANNSCHFENHLSKAINLPDNIFEVGLVSLSYTHPELVVRQQDTGVKEKITQEKNTFFKGEAQTLTIYEYSGAEIAVRKPQNRQMDYLQVLIENEVKGPKSSLQITELVISETESKSVLTWIDTEKERNLEISNEFARAFGFEILFFRPGRYTSSNYRDQLYYDSLPYQFRFSFNLSYWAKTPLVLNEPDLYTPASFVTRLADAFRSRKYKVGFILSKAKDTLTVRIYQPNLRFQLSNKINEILGIDRSFLFENEKTQLFLPKTFTNAKPEEVVPNNIVTWKPSNAIYVYSDIVNEQFIGSKALSVLRIIHGQGDPNSSVEHNFQSVFYFTPSRTHVRSISLSLRLEDGTYLNPTDNPTIAVLHFKKKWV
jgi:hypothetical protein